ncbi:AI-2E family transporter [Myxococcaceae bacterium GXIMD 01537]
MAPRTSNFQVSPVTVWRICLQVLLVVALVALVLKAWVVVSWSLLALLLALALLPPVRWLGRYMPRGMAVLVMVIGALGLVLAAVVWLVPPFLEQARLLAEHTPALVGRLREQEGLLRTEGPLQHFDLMTELERAGPRLAVPLIDVVKDLARVLAATVTIATLTGFMLLSGPSLAETAIGWVRPSERPRYLRIAGDIVGKMGGYVAGTLFLVVLNGAVVTTLMLVLGVPYALPLGAVCALLSLIPYAGSTAFMVVLGGVVFASRGGHVALLAVGGTFLYFVLKDRLLDPLVMRHTTQLNPLLSTEVILLGTAVAGVKGTVLALPVAAAVQVILMEVKARRDARWAARGEGGPRVPPREPSTMDERLHGQGR